MKWKQMYLAEKDKVSDLEYKLSREQKDKFEAIKKFESIDMAIKRFEGKESDVVRENEWLKTTLRLAILSDEKVKAIVDELEVDPFTGKRKL